MAYSASLFDTRNSSFTLAPAVFLPSVTPTVILRQPQQQQQEQLSKNVEYGIFILNGILALLGVLGNIFVCMIIIRGRKMYTIANLFLMNLAIADMCVLVVSYPLWVIKILAPLNWPFGSVLCKIIPSVSDAFYGVSLGCMTTISIHRYRMILHAMNAQLSFLQAKLVIIFIWIISLASIAAPLYPVLRYYEGVNKKNMTYFNVTLLHEMPYKHCRSKWPSRTYEKSYQTFLTIVWYILPLLIILVTFLRIKCYLQRQMAYEWLKGSEHNVLITNQILGIKKALRMLAPVVIIFAILMLPWNILRMLSVFMDFSKIKNAQIYVLVSGTMLVANSVVNPFIYYIMSREFRIEFRKQFWLLKKALRLTQESDQYTIESDESGKKYVRRFRSFMGSKRDSNGNFSTISMSFPSKTRTESTASDFTFSNGAPAVDYDEIFREQSRISNGDNYRPHGDNQRYTHARAEPLYSIKEEQNLDLDSKDSGFEGCITPEKNAEVESAPGENVGLLCEEIIRETVL
ncbi:QRFP-like peptide receptor [Hydractinia symbiolongicarpus]|uniref:QRFP-like peptide receptor n=1 Tax=Hydractinia symbiolongicarpus TaxID=13093 RepID=UPI00254D3EA0|nr:QRFP-like peptide receptor [Hydractinia symbiolongicarpus]